ncbi:MAG: beta-ketoacyl-ACP synthase II [Dehalococcoidia bacterium]|nr:beta-ketoacyl-ACP synthase II [Dehalococcoidia bacterium]
MPPLERRNRAVITGIGMITPIGNDTETFWSNALAGRSGAGPITQFDATDFPVQIAAEVKDFDPSQFMDFKAAKRMHRFSQFAVAAAKMAVDDAGIKFAPEELDDTAVIINTGAGGIGDVEDATETYLQKGPNRVSPMLVPSLIPNMAASNVSMAFGLRGPVLSGVAACASGIFSVVDAQRYIERGECEIVLAGSAEAALIPVAFAGMANMKALTDWKGDPAKASRPFDRDRTGFLFGEGAGVMVIESEAHARKRGARVYAEVAGGAFTGDAYHITAPEPTGYGAALAMQRALTNAGVAPADVNYICAHGTGTPLNDAAETRAIKKVFGDHAHELAISSPKSMVGHLLGAAGAISSTVCALAIRDGRVPPTINLDNPDPECDLDYVANASREMTVDVAIANGFGFGGQNGVAVFKRHEER